MAQYDSNSNATEWLKGEETSTAKHLKIDKASNVKIEPDIVNVSAKPKRVHFAKTAKCSRFYVWCDIFAISTEFWAHDDIKN